MTGASIADAVATQPFFAGLAGEGVAQVAGCAVNVAFRPGALLVAEGSPADSFYLIRRGRVAIEVHSPERGAVVIETLGPGACVGWSWMIPPYRWHFDARAIDPVGAIAVDGACLRSKADADPALGFALMTKIASVLVERLQATRVRLLDLYGDHGDR